MVRGVKTVALFIGGVLGVVLLLGTVMWGGAGWLVARKCADRLHDCYLATRMPDRLKQTRVGTLSQFAASDKKIAFPIPVKNEDIGLLVFDRGSGQPKIVYEDGFRLLAPSFSVDGSRLLLIRRESGTAQAQILSCIVNSWRCSVLLTTNDNLRSPVDAGNGAIVYSASPVHVAGNRAYYSDWNLYYLKPGDNPLRLSKFDFYRLDSINVTDDKIVFSASGPKPDNPVIPQSKPLAPNESEIYAVHFDRAAERIVQPVATLSSLFRIEGLSVSATVSADGTWAAVRNTRIDHFKYRYDLVLMNKEQFSRRLVLSGLGFSAGVFVGRTMVFSEMFDDRYDLRLLDFGDGSIRTIASVNAAPSWLRSLERIRLTMEGEQYAAEAAQ